MEHPAREIILMPSKINNLPVFAACNIEDRLITSPNCSHIPLPICEKPNDSQDPLSLMWFDLSQNDFVPHPESAVDGFGCLSQSKHADFEDRRVQLMERVAKRTTGQHQLDVRLASMVKIMNHTCVRMAETSTTIEEIQFTIVEFQRYFLEVQAMLDWDEYYEPRIRRRSMSTQSSIQQLKQWRVYYRRKCCCSIVLRWPTCFFDPQSQNRR